MHPVKRSHAREKQRIWLPVAAETARDYTSRKPKQSHVWPVLDAPTAGLITLFIETLNIRLSVRWPTGLDSCAHTAVPVSHRNDNYAGKARLPSPHDCHVTCLILTSIVPRSISLDSPSFWLPPFARVKVLASQVKANFQVKRLN